MLCLLSALLHLPLNTVHRRRYSNKGKEENRHRRFRFHLSYQIASDNQEDNATLMQTQQIIITISAGAQTKVKG